MPVLEVVKPNSIVREPTRVIRYITETQRGDLLADLLLLVGGVELDSSTGMIFAGLLVDPNCLKARLLARIIHE